MTIALDATPLTVSTGGIRRYTEELARALAAGGDAVWLLSDRAFEMPVDAALRRGDMPRNTMERRWWLHGLPRELRRTGADVFHGTDFAVPYVRACPAVITIHDLSPWTDSAWRDPGASRVRRRTPWLLHLHKADMIITPSGAVREQVIARFGVPPATVAAVPHAAAACFRPAAPSRAGRYFLYAGTIEARKNVGMLLEAWHEVRRTHAIDLVLAGRMHAQHAPIAPEPGLHLAGSVSDSELATLYSGAIASLYPSLYEGFGLPVLEAMQCGAPVIASRDPAIVETGGGAALHVDARDVRGWAAAMSAVTTDAELRQQLRLRSLARAAQFSWQRTAEMTRAVYAEAIGRHRAVEAVSQA